MRWADKSGYWAVGTLKAAVVETLWYSAVRELEGLEDRQDSV